MTAQLDHTIVLAHDKQASAAFLSDLLGLPAPEPIGPFMAVAADNGVTLDFMDTDGDITQQHYAFAVADDEFDEIFGRIRERGLPFWADPYRSRPNEIRKWEGSRGVYFEDPSGHLLEILTR